MIAFKDKNDGYYQFDWDGVSALPEWTKDMTQIDVVTALVVPPTYAELRASSIPIIADQLDTIYHETLGRPPSLQLKRSFPSE
jgi:hypothetical protein